MDLVLQLLASTVLMTIATTVHGTGVVAMGKLFRYEDEALKGRRLADREFRLMVPMALCLFALHTIEIGIFAAFYLLVGAISSFEQALFFSASAYTTLGHVESDMVTWRLVGAFEGLAGFLLIGWSAAVFVTDMDKVLRRN
jgi:hypothetical protein